MARKPQTKSQKLTPPPKPAQPKPWFATEAEAIEAVWSALMKLDDEARDAVVGYVYSRNLAWRHKRGG